MISMYQPNDPMQHRGYQQLGEDVRQGRGREVLRLGCLACIVPVVLVVAFVVVTFTVSFVNDVF